MTVNTEAWLGGLVSAASGGALSSLTAMGFAPESFNFVDKVALAKTAGVAVVGIVIGVLNYLKQSPLSKGEQDAIKTS